MVLFALTSSSSSKLKQRSHQSFSESLMEDSIEDAESIIHRWISPQLLDISSSSSFCCITSLFSTGNREEATRFIAAVKTLHSGMVRLISTNPASLKLVRAENLMRISMDHLAKEFYRILKSNRRYLDPESVSVRSRKVSHGEDADAMADLKMIADCMTSSGYGRECFRIYRKIRKSIIVEAMDRLGFEDLSLSQMQKLDWEYLEKKMRNWLRAARKAVTTLFYGERILSDHVFSSSSAAIRESSFAEITLQSALTMFTFPENMAKSRKSPEKIFLTLDVYQSIVELLPVIEEVFSYDSTSPVKSQIDVTLTDLEEGVISMLDEFESSIAKESSKSLISGGGIHQLTRYVMNFIVFLADYSDPLADIISKTPSSFTGDVDSSSSSSPLAKRISWLILFLLCKIDAKSRLYNDVALSYLFLINNLNYVGVKVRTSNLKEILSEDWLEKHEGKVKKYVAKFVEIVWGEMVVMMTSLSTTAEEEEEEEAEEVVRRFSDRFEEAYKRQTGWVVPDSKLRDEIKVSVAMMLIPAYAECNKKCRVGLRKNVGFVPEDIGNYLSDLYFGTGGSGIVSSIHSSDTDI
ncbi:hypothetical protein EUTSA_v10017781mg [Eutrema salsugineum]|uniref:Exocyst subunit Exo70 family protein n=1 Tax=Eutrema salsugineum TaxID=72664 RepID=V4NWV3_EUTSA|nr:exocyst complex component EXO70H1 [Eutrema salsugineum]ESQ51351.1 hypothetical protein EUTSA_v10017781mg [Eutrema salsugineum]